jgi:hypothetical protein
MQRYEAASTIYGPHTLTAYLQLFEQVWKVKKVYSLPR